MQGSLSNVKFDISLSTFRLSSLSIDTDPTDVDEPKMEVQGSKERDE